MAPVELTNVIVLNNPAEFLTPFQFEITFIVNEPLKKDLEWNITYVGSAETDQMDQVLDTVLIGPIETIGQPMRFVFQADPPDYSKINEKDLLGVTAVLLTCSYDGKEFIRVGYYVNNEYTDPELRENPPARTDVAKVTRNILADKPRVTRFNIDWDLAPPPAPPLPTPTLIPSEGMYD
eukprot:TRINITY_DN8903_c0_g1::TRINITY_DN8903_c0_g1_i1::g.18993::m.18993 TRINITY_DN8903_c0_g1::TRINITY_DN8903_c0_g1_i1::g.18993  ORF type:complete len:186 (+),score=20.35,sp/Q9V464/ASF1_DROME/63.92/6e-67,ASF1_hist_chap/PF04729.8/2e-63 TRINITY_DN8903_c0_g1_i1:24-560(+)